MARTKMTDAEKAEAAGVRDYLKALEQKAPRRGRRNAASIRKQLASVDAQMKGASVTTRLKLIQQRIDLETELESLKAGGKVNMGTLEKRFIRHAASYSGRRGISHAAWREIGVSAAVLKAAGIRRNS